MKLKPALKQKKRYVVIEVSCPNAPSTRFSASQVSAALEESFERFLGLLIVSKLQPKILTERFNEESQRIIVKVSHNYVNELKASLLFIKEINQKPVSVHSIISSGILAKAAKHLER